MHAFTLVDVDFRTNHDRHLLENGGEAAVTDLPSTETCGRWLVSCHADSGGCRKHATDDAVRA